MELFTLITHDHGDMEVSLHRSAEDADHAIYEWICEAWDSDYLEANIEGFPSVKEVINHFFNIHDEESYSFSIHPTELAGGHPELPQANVPQAAPAPQTAPEPGTVYLNEEELSILDLCLRYTNFEGLLTDHEELDLGVTLDTSEKIQKKLGAVG